MKLATSAFALGAILSACTTGDEGTMMPNPNGMNCSAALTISGTFTADASAPAPADYNGCWPAGTWTFAAQVADNNCATAPQLGAMYSFKGEQEWACQADPGTHCRGDADCAGLSPTTCDHTQPIVDLFTLVTPDPSSMKNIVKVSELGNGICEGEVDLYSADQMQVWTFRPDLQQAVGNTLTGQGEYGEYTTPQYPL